MQIKYYKKIQIHILIWREYVLDPMLWYTQEEKKQEAQMHPYHIIKRIKQLLRIFIHVTKNLKRYPQRLFYGITYGLRCCKKGRRTIEKGKKSHFWPISNVWMDTRNTHHGKYDRKLVQVIKWAKFWKQDHKRYCWRSYRRIINRQKPIWRFLDIIWIW